MGAEDDSGRGVTLVRLGPGQERRLRAVRLRALEDAPAAFASTLAETAARPPASWQQQLRDLATWVAVADGEDVGLVRGGPHQDQPGDGILLSMWVAPVARGQGVGEALVLAVIDWALAAGHRRLVLEVADDNGPAVALYALVGFMPTGQTSALPPPRSHVLEHARARVLDPGPRDRTPGPRR